jgi:putative phosphoribosyl transferase
VELDGDIFVPKKAPGIVVFAHGSGSNRHSPRNRAVARVMNEAGLGTLLVSLLTLEEEAEDIIKSNLRFNIKLLGDRLIAVADWLQENEETKGLKLGLFGSSTGAAGALLCAAGRPEIVGAVVSRGGRPDMAADVLDRVKAPTLLLVGSLDQPVIEMNRKAFGMLRSTRDLIIIPGATHLFEEPGTLELVGRYARDWFIKYL